MHCDLNRFVEVHQRDYARALQEVKNGRKRSCWMWYIFPQLRGLGFSATAQQYGITGMEEAVQFLAHPYLGGHLREISEALLELETNHATAVFGIPDDRKLQSSMTLFACVDGEDSVFARVLDKFFSGKPDDNTLTMLREAGVLIPPSVQERGMTDEEKIDRAAERILERYQSAFEELAK